MSNGRSGQVLLVVLLSTAVVLTLVLSVVSKSITDISVTTSEEEALRAFSAAEAGVEEALVSGTGMGGTGTGSVGVQATDLEADYSYVVDGFPVASTSYVYPFELGSGESGTVWLMPHNSDGTLDPTCTVEGCFDGTGLMLCWGQDVGAVVPAVEVSVVYQDPTDLRIKTARLGSDPVASRRAQNNFSDASSGGACNNVAGESFAYRKDINLTGNPNPLVPVNPSAGQFKWLRVRMLYNTDKPHAFALINNSGGGAVPFPGQGRRIESSGSSGVSTRKVEVYSLYPEPPSVFDAALFSPNDIVK